MLLIGYRRTTKHMEKGQFSRFGKLGKIVKDVADKYVFYNRIAIVLYDVENYERPNYNRFVKNGFEIKRIKTIDKNIEEKLIKALSKVDFQPLPFDVNEAKERLRNNYCFVVVEHNDKFVGWTWDAVGFVLIPELQERIELRDKEAFSFNTYIEKSYRSKGLNKLMLHGKISFLYDEGFKKEWGHIWRWNIPSLKSFTHMGWKIVGTYHYFRLFFIKIRYRSYSKTECAI